MHTNSPAQRAWFSLWLLCAFASRQGFGAESILAPTLPAESSSTLAAPTTGAELCGYGEMHRPVDSGYDADVTCCYDTCCNLCPCSYAWAEGLIVGRDNRSSDQPLVLDLNTD